MLAFSQSNPHALSGTLPFRGLSRALSPKGRAGEGTLVRMNTVDKLRIAERLVENGVFHRPDVLRDAVGRDR